MSERKIKMGIFGGYRGSSFYKCVLANNAEIVAVCDFNEKYANKAKEMLGDDVAVYTAFDDFIEHEGVEAVLLSNYFHEHAPYAIRLLERGIHVLSECTSNATMAQGVALVRAAAKRCRITSVVEDDIDVRIYPDKFDVGVWSDLAFEYKGRLRIIMTENPGDLPRE